MVEALAALRVSHSCRRFDVSFVLNGCSREDLADRMCSRSGTSELLYAVCFATSNSVCSSSRSPQPMDRDCFQTVILTQLHASALQRKARIWTSPWLVLLCHSTSHPQTLRHVQNLLTESWVEQHVPYILVIGEDTLTHETAIAPMSA
eukprot:3939420-Amphidinium_carterae.1